MGSSSSSVKEGKFVKVEQQDLPTHMNAEFVRAQESKSREGDVGQQHLPENLSGKPAPMQDDKSQELKHNDREMVMALSRLHTEFASIRSESTNAKEVWAKQLALQQEHFQASIDSVVENVEDLETRFKKLGGLVRLCTDFESRLSAHENRLDKLAGIENIVHAFEDRLAVHEDRLDTMLGEVQGLETFVREINDAINSTPEQPVPVAPEQPVPVVAQGSARAGSFKQQTRLPTTQGPTDQMPPPPLEVFKGQMAALLQRCRAPKSAELLKKLDADFEGAQDHADEHLDSESLLAENQCLTEPVTPELHSASEFGSRFASPITASRRSPTARVVEFNDLVDYAQRHSEKRARSTELPVFKGKQFMTVVGGNGSGSRAGNAGGGHGSFRSNQSPGRRRILVPSASCTAIPVRSESRHVSLAHSSSESQMLDMQRAASFSAPTGTTTPSGTPIFVPKVQSKTPATPHLPTLTPPLPRPQVATPRVPGPEARIVSPRHKLSPRAVLSPRHIAQIEQSDLLKMQAVMNMGTVTNTGTIRKSIGCPNVRGI